MEVVRAQCEQQLLAISQEENRGIYILMVKKVLISSLIQLSVSSPQLSLRSRKRIRDFY